MASNALYATPESISSTTTKLVQLGKRKLLLNVERLLSSRALLWGHLLPWQESLCLSIGTQVLLRLIASALHLVNLLAIQISAFTNGLCVIPNSLGCLLEVFSKYLEGIRCSAEVAGPRLCLSLSSHDFLSILLPLNLLSGCSNGTVCRVSRGPMKPHELSNVLHCRDCFWAF